MNIIRQKAVLAEIERRFAPQGNGNGGVIIQPSYIQLEVALALNKTNYSFILNQNGGGVPRNSERRINQNDLFVATDMALRLKQEDSNKAGQEVLQAYANATAIAPEPSQVTQKDVDAVFNSSLSVKVGDTVYGEAIDLSPCRVVGTTAQSSSSTRSELHSMEGVLSLEPFITFDGSKKNDLQLNLQYAGLIQSASPTLTVYAVLKFWGFLVTGTK